MKYTKETPRITVKVYNSDTEELLITMTDRNWTNVGEVFPAHHITSLMVQEVKNKKKSLPKKVLVMIAEEYILED
jgi:hypothetical protein